MCDDATERKAHKMRLLDAEVVDNLQHLTCSHVEVERF
jgi:hypothetical protein